MKYLILFILLFSHAFAQNTKAQAWDRLRPIQFPIGGAYQYSIEGQLALFTRTIQRRCESNYRVRYNSKAILSINKIDSEETRITCAFPLLIADLNRYGTDIYKYSLNGSNLLHTLASRLIDYDLLNPRIIEGSKDLPIYEKHILLLNTLRLIRASLPVVLKKTKFWFQNTSIVFFHKKAYHKIFAAWLSQLTPFSYTQDLSKSLSCLRSTRRDCQITRNKLLRKLYDAELKIKNNSKWNKLIFGLDNIPDFKRNQFVRMLQKSNTYFYGMIGDYQENFIGPVVMNLGRNKNIRWDEIQNHYYQVKPSYYIPSLKIISSWSNSCEQIKTSFAEFFHEPEFSFLENPGSLDGESCDQELFPVLCKNKQNLNNVSQQACPDLKADLIGWFKSTKSLDLIASYQARVGMLSYYTYYLDADPAERNLMRLYVLLKDIQKTMRTWKKEVSASEMEYLESSDELLQNDLIQYLETLEQKYRN